MDRLISTPEQLGSYIRAARKRLGLTQPQLSRATGVGVRFIVELERGKATASLGRALQVLQAVGGSFHIIDQEPS